MWDGLAMIHKFKLSYYLIVGCVSVCIPALPNHLCAVPLLDPQIQTDTPPDCPRAVPKSSTSRLSGLDTLHPAGG